MRVLHLFIILIVLAVLGAIGAAFFELATIPFLSEFAYTVKGYPLAKKDPDEALNLYKKALEARKYSMAARYLDGDYGRDVRKNAKVATRLANAIDNFRNAGKDRSLVTDKVDAMLAILEPYPKTISIKDVKTSQGGDSATAIITLEGSSRQSARLAGPVSLKKVEEAWKIEIPLTPDRRAFFDQLEKNGQAYVNALDVVKNRMKTDATTKNDVEGDLLNELTQVDQTFWQQFRR